MIHTCCAPCSTYTVDFWREQRHELSGYWSNPNIHPFDEHRQRLQTMEDYARSIGLPLIVASGFHPEDYFQAVAGHEMQVERCRYCYTLRLSHAAAAAKREGFDAFTTTLLISPYQDQEWIRQIGQETQAKAGVRFLYQDLRPGYRRSREMAREAGLYRQRYCGCRYRDRRQKTEDRR
ncbi:MAG: epoxyqueuosine reductase QueH [Chloroflexi bacterium]|nr:epoxyqueuosine reductase QueH [Chloroflexota bacterium]